MADLLAGICEISEHSPPEKSVSDVQCQSNDIVNDQVQCVSRIDSVSQLAPIPNQLQDVFPNTCNLILKCPTPSKKAAHLESVCPF